jgi:hypothetical protein
MKTIIYMTTDLIAVNFFVALFATFEHKKDNSTSHASASVCAPGGSFFAQIGFGVVA